MKLSNFEEQINPTILQRGLFYYQIKAVVALEETSEGKWEAQVEGTDLYSIGIKLSGDTVTHHFCDCPYNMGEFCKHEVAVFYALNALKNNHTSQDHSKPKKMTLKKKIEIILDKLSEQDIRTYLQNSLLKSKKQRDSFLIHFDHLLDEAPNPNKYKSRVESIIYGHSDHGFIDYYASSKVCDELLELLEQATAALNNNPELAFTISRTVLEAIPGLMESMDDSNGESGSVTDVALDIIIEYLDQVTVQGDKKKIERAFDWCMQTTMNKGYSDYGHDEVHQLFDYFCTDDSPYKDRLLQVQDLKIAKASEYTISGLLATKADLLQKWGDEEAAREIILNNLDKTTFRQKVIDEALSQRNFKEAITLIRGGIAIAEKKQHPGTVMQWNQQLLSIAQEQKDQQEIMRLAELLLLRRFSMDYYRLLKRSSIDWTSDYPRLLKKIGSECELAQVYQEEGDHHSLFKLVEDKPDQGRSFYNAHSRFDLFKQYLDILVPHYPNEILDIFEKYIYGSAKQTGRRVYEDIASDLRLLKKLKGGEQRVKGIVEHLLETYRNRPAMREILGRVV